MNSTPLSEMPPDIQQKVLESGLKRWQTETLTGLQGIEMMQNHLIENEKNIAAENEFVRKSVWGSEGQANPEAGGEMRQTVLGNLTHPTPVIINNPPNGLGKILAGAALATGLIGIPGALAISYLVDQLNKPTATQPPLPKDKPLVIRLLDIEDLKPKQ